MSFLPRRTTIIPIGRFLLSGDAVPSAIREVSTVNGERLEERADMGGWGVGGLGCSAATSYPARRGGAIEVEEIQPRGGLEPP